MKKFVIAMVAAAAALSIPGAAVADAVMGAGFQQAQVRMPQPMPDPDPDENGLPAKFRLVNTGLNFSASAIALAPSSPMLLNRRFSLVTTDVPEHAFLASDTETNWNTRARGLGGTVAVPTTSCAEENVLCLPGDRYRGESILVHELAHGVFNLGVDAGLRAEFRAALRSPHRLLGRAPVDGGGGADADDRSTGGRSEKLAVLISGAALTHRA